MTEGVTEQIDNSLGTFVQNNPNNFGGNWKSYMRIRVNIDINRSLRRKLKLKKKGGEWIWVTFKYERLYTFCYFCGCIGHSEKFYSKAMDSEKASREMEYGPWLRAPIRRFTTTVGERWLVNDDPLHDCDESGSHSGGDSVAITPRLTLKTPSGNDDAEQHGMDVDDEGVTVSKTKRRRGLYGQDDVRTAQLVGFGSQPIGGFLASPASQARPSS